MNYEYFCSTCLLFCFSRENAGHISHNLVMKSTFVIKLESVTKIQTGETLCWRPFWQDTLEILLKLIMAKMVIQHMKSISYECVWIVDYGAISTIHIRNQICDILDGRVPTGLPPKWHRIEWKRLFIKQNHFVYQIFTYNYVIYFTT